MRNEIETWKTRIYQFSQFDLVCVKSHLAFKLPNESLKWNLISLPDRSLHLLLHWDLRRQGDDTVVSIITHHVLGQIKATIITDSLIALCIACFSFRSCNSVVSNFSVKLAVGGWISKHFRVNEGLVRITSDVSDNWWALTCCESGRPLNVT